MSTSVSDKLTGKNRIGFVRKCLMWPKQKFYYKDGGMFLTADEAKNDDFIRNIPGRQNKHKGHKPGSYKHKRDIIRNSRRRNRS